jgi:hypothetical protein
MTSQFNSLYRNLFFWSWCRCNSVAVALQRKSKKIETKFNSSSAIVHVACIRQLQVCYKEKHKGSGSSYWGFLLAEVFLSCLIYEAQITSLCGWESLKLQSSIRLAFTMSLSNEVPYQYTILLIICVLQCSCMCNPSRTVLPHKSIYISVL